MKTRQRSHDVAEALSSWAKRTYAGMWRPRWRKKLRRRLHKHDRNEVKQLLRDGQQP